MKTVEQWANEFDADRRHLLELLTKAVNRLIDHRDFHAADELLSEMKKLPSMKVLELRRPK